MRALPTGIETDTVIAALADGWGLDVDGADYAAVGGGSYHWVVTAVGGTCGFVTVDDLDHKLWLGDTRDAACEALGRAFDTAAVLRAAGLEFVVAPVPTSRGESLRRIGPRHTIALFPFVGGEAGRFGHYDDGVRAALASMLAELHVATPAAGSAPRGLGLELPGRRTLEAALRDLDQTWSGGPLSEPARHVFARHAGDVAEFLSVADRLAAAVEKRGSPWVVTHGEPHSANVMRTDSGHVLVDWDTVALAPRERDLWMLVEDGGENLTGYTDATGHELDGEAVDFFRLTWDLKDLAEYLNVLRSPHHESEDTVRDLEGLTRSVPSRDQWSRLLG
jgi:spectinomycin phosphotransferase